MKYASQSIGEFLRNVASTNVTPAGGTAAAVVGATGASLCEMVCIHTIENEPTDGETRELVDVRDDLATQRVHLLELADADSAAVEAVLSDDDLTERKRAVGVPLTIATACRDVLDQATVVTERGRRTAVPDGVTGGFLAHAALRATVYTVRSNLPRIPDPSFVERVEQRADDIERSGERAYEQVVEHGHSYLRTNK
jgi:formiminotetrahydrofolate cyclodeaminase